MKKVGKVICIFIIVCLPLYLFISEFHCQMRELKGNDYQLTNQLFFGVDTFEITDEFLNVSGWLVYPGHGQYNNLFNKQVWLQNLDSKEIFMLKTKAVVRTDITKVMADQVDYDRAGFESTISLSSTFLESGNYELLLCYQYQGENLVIDTGRRVRIP